MKVKFIKDLYSSLGEFKEGQTYDLDFPEHVLPNWIENGFCEEVKKARVKKNEDVASAN